MFALSNMICNSGLIQVLPLKRASLSLCHFKLLKPNWRKTPQATKQGTSSSSFYFYQQCTVAKGTPSKINTTIELLYALQTAICHYSMIKRFD